MQSGPPCLEFTSHDCPLAHQKPVPPSVCRDYRLIVIIKMIKITPITVQTLSTLTNLNYDSAQFGLGAIKYFGSFQMKLWPSLCRTKIVILFIWVFVRLTVFAFCLPVPSQWPTGFGLFLYNTFRTATVEISECRNSGFSHTQFVYF
jgi:hypothetical protein